jgi:hypothetical protein
MADVVIVNGDHVTLKASEDLAPIFNDLNMFGSCDRRTQEAAVIGGRTGVASGVSATQFTFTKDLNQGEIASAQTLPRSAVLSNEGQG